MRQVLGLAKSEQADGDTFYIIGCPDLPSSELENSCQSGKTFLVKRTTYVAHVDLCRLELREN